MYFSDHQQGSVWQHKKMTQLLKSDRLFGISEQK